MKKISLIALAFAASIMTTSMALAQGGNPQVSAVNLRIVQNQGYQSVVTPKGDLAPLPGAGVNGDTVQIYMGSQGGFWYTDRNGQTVDLTPAVQALQARRAQGQQAAQVPQYAPTYQQQPQQVIVNQQQPSNSGSSAAATLGTMAAAGAGAMAGAAMTNSYYHVPYGTPMYYGAHGNPYYYNNGNREDINLNENQKTAMYNHAVVNQQQQAQNQAMAQQAYANKQATAAQSTQSTPEHQNFQKQQEWYQNQVKSSPGKYQQAAGNNPFVASQAAGQGGSEGRFGGRRGAAQQDAAAGEGGRFGGRRAGGNDGNFGGGEGRFGGGGAAGGRAGRRR